MHDPSAPATFAVPCNGGEQFTTTGGELLLPALAREAAGGAALGARQTGQRRRRPEPHRFVR
ncbi:hypothetical protein [Streptomyces sp. MMG1121]|uniref:hypothetical protein n=1 Tax=Streptomyces sp. MMG1121 TaxID=1415544 RepID=UPI00131AF2C6|nr:hypothetical protein [Streptomyces sp. MMG1121]